MPPELEARRRHAEDRTSLRLEPTGSANELLSVTPEEMATVMAAFKV